MKIHHIGYLVRDIEKSLEMFLAFEGYEQMSGIVNDNCCHDNQLKPRNVKICFIKNFNNVRGGGTCIELVSPIDTSSDVYKILQRQGEGPYHICYETNNLDDKIAELKSKGWIVVHEPATAVAIQGRRVAFLFKNGMGLIEILEE